MSRPLPLPSGKVTNMFQGAVTGSYRLGNRRDAFRRVKDQRVLGWITLLVGTACGYALLAHMGTSVRLIFGGGTAVSLALFLSTTMSRPWDDSRSEFTKQAGEFMALYGLGIVTLSVLIRVVSG